MLWITPIILITIICTHKEVLKKGILNNKNLGISFLLREKGWKDWHVLMAILNLVLNYRYQHKTNNLSMDDYFKFYVDRPEESTDLIVPLTEFTEKNLKLNLESSMMATMTSLGFSLKGKPIKIDEVSKFLGEKFNYWNDDVPHEDIFN